MTDDTVKHVKELVTKAANSQDSMDAMRFAQAACNAANAIALLDDVQRRDEKKPG